MKVELIGNTWKYKEGQTYAETFELLPGITIYRSVKDAKGNDYSQSITLSFLIFEISLFLKEKGNAPGKQIGFVGR